MEKPSGIGDESVHSIQRKTFYILGLRGNSGVRGESAIGPNAFHPAQFAHNHNGCSVVAPSDPDSGNSGNRVDFGGSRRTLETSGSGEGFKGR